jgi:hypothetical protein
VHEHSPRDRTTRPGGVNEQLALRRDGAVHAQVSVATQKGGDQIVIRRLAHRRGLQGGTERISKGLQDRDIDALKVAGGSDALQWAFREARAEDGRGSVIRVQ